MVNLVMTEKEAVAMFMFYDIATDVIMQGGISELKLSLYLSFFAYWNGEERKNLSKKVGSIAENISEETMDRYHLVKVSI